MNSIFNNYLTVLNVPRRNPSLKYLKELTTSQLINIPFENISKLHYFHSNGLKTIPDIELYLSGIQENNFGGTCYSNNYHFNQLLNFLGFEAWLSGADMNIPDAHLVNIVCIGSEKYLVDVGYGAPFFDPFPTSIKNVCSIIHGNDKYSFFPMNDNGYLELKHFRNNDQKHGYSVKPQRRLLNEFSKVIEDSFTKSATFLNRITIIKFDDTSSKSVKNYSFITVKDNKVDKKELLSVEEIVRTIAGKFNIPYNIVRETLNSIKIL